MTDYIDLALKYGGFTSLDKVYLTRTLADMTDQERLTFITPPPSVINAYFAQLYQKKSPEAATAYLLDISQALDLFNAQPSFAEEKPFIRLNLTGQSYGFCFESADELGLVFPENPSTIDADLLFQVAQLFPHYLVYEEGQKVRTRVCDLDAPILESQSLSSLTDLHILENGVKQLVGYNQEEITQFAEGYSGQAYYRSQNRTAMIYIV